MKLKPSILDYFLFRYKKFDQVISLRNEIKEMLKIWNELPIITRISYPDVSTIILTKYEMITFNEVSCYEKEGLPAVLSRLKNDRESLFKLLKVVTELNLDVITSEERNRKLELLGI